MERRLSVDGEMGEGMTTSSEGEWYLSLLETTISWTQHPKLGFDEEAWRAVSRDVIANMAARGKRISAETSCVGHGLDTSRECFSVRIPTH